MPPRNEVTKDVLRHDQFARSKVSVWTALRWWAMSASRSTRWSRVSTARSASTVMAPLADASKPVAMASTLPRRATEDRMARRILATSFASNCASSVLSHKKAHFVLCPSKACRRLCHLDKGAAARQARGKGIGVGTQRERYSWEGERVCGERVVCGGGGAGGWGVAAGRERAG